MFCTCCDIFHWFISVKHNHVLTGEMDLKADDGGFLVVDDKFEKMLRHL
jgi:hypothetical protein